MSRPSRFTAMGEIGFKDGFYTINAGYYDPVSGERMRGSIRITDQDFQLWDEKCLGRASSLQFALSPSLLDKSRISVTRVASVFVLTRDAEGLDPRLPIVGVDNIFTVCYAFQGELADQWRALQAGN